MSFGDGFKIYIEIRTTMNKTFYFSIHNIYYNFIINIIIKNNNSKNKKKI